MGEGHFDRPRECGGGTFQQTRGVWGRDISTDQGSVEEGQRTITPGCHSWSHPHYHPHTVTSSHCHTLTLSHPHPTPSHSSTLSLMVQVDLTTDYQGFVRVHMCVTRPIHVSAGVTKNSWYGLMKPVRAKSRRYARGKGKTPRRDAGRDCGDNEVCGEIQ